MTMFADSRQRTVAAILLAVVVVGLSLLAVVRLWPLNRYALATAERLLHLGAGPGWWLAPVSTTTCQPEAPPAGGDPVTQARLQRLYGLQAAYCDDTATAQAALAAAAAVLTDDASLQPFVGGTSPSRPGVGPALAAERARTAYDRGENAEAARWLEEAATYLAEPTNADYRSLYFVACYVYRGLDELDKSLLACQKYTTVSPNSKEAWNHLAATHLARREWTAAEEALDRALALDPAWLPAAVQLVTALTAQGKEEAALAFYEGVRAQAATDAWSSYYLAQMAVRLRRCAEARGYFQAANANPPAALQSALTRLQRRLASTCP